MAYPRPRFQGTTRSRYAQAVRRKCLRARLPAKSDAAAELAVPHPPPVAGKPRHTRAVGEDDALTDGFSIDKAGRRNASCVGGDALQFFPCGGLPADVVGRPASFERVGIAGRVLPRGPDQCHLMGQAANSGVSPAAGRHK